MKKPFNSIKKFILDILFPKFCLNCNREGEYLCEDCFYLIDILENQYCPFCWPPKVTFNGKTCKFCRRTKNLTGLFCATPYNNLIIKNLINQFKYPPYVKEMSKPLTELIIAHFIKLDKTKRGLTPFEKKELSSLIIIPVPLYKKKLKRRGYNQAEEIGKELSQILKIPTYSDILIKIKKTPAQVELNKKQRKKNIQGIFSCIKPKLIKNKKILLIDDIFTTGSTMEECAKILKQSGAKEIWGIVVARG